MKKTGLLHAELSRVIAGMGHLDTLVIGDAGLPVPKGVPVIDLALKQGVPGFLETLEVVLSELEVQDAIVASEQAPLSADMHAAFTELWNARTPVQEIPHEDFKTRMKDAKAVVRTGEFTPYSNVILVAGVVF